YFSRARGGAGFGLAQLMVVITSIVSLIALSQPSGDLFNLLLLDHDASKDGELWRLFTVTLVHAPGSDTSPWFSLHLLLNMYALWILCPLLELILGTALVLL